MRAWQVHRTGEPREALRLTDLPVPEPGTGEVRIRVAAVAVGMPDVFMCRDSYALRPPLPFVAGQEVCGIVDAVGDGVDAALVGRRVMSVTNFYVGHGGFAEYTLANAPGVFRVPDSMSDADAASFRIGFSTAWIGLVRRGNLQPGEHLVVLGAAGGSGITAVQLGKALGASVTAVAAGAEKLEFCRRMGADAIIDRTASPTLAAVADAIRDATGGHGADVVYDPVGGDLAQASSRTLARDGRLLVVGYASGSWVDVKAYDLLRANASLVGVYAGSYTREENEADHEALLALAADGKLDSFATVVPFERVPDALTVVGDGTVIGKMVVAVTPAG
jgi:NADPH2:quinone reductase